MSLIVYGLGGNFLLTYGLGFLEEILLGPEGIQQDLSQILIDLNKSSLFMEINKSLASLNFDASLTSLDFNRSLTFIDICKHELKVKEG